jgi:hypothetical protein
MHAERMLRSAESNPFYLLSALFMLVGCFALSHQLSLQSGQWKPLLLLIGVLQIYELIVLAMAVYLNRRAPAGIEAKALFVLGLLFLVDATYLNVELAASNPWVAAWASLALLVLGAIKLLVLRASLGLTSRRALAVAVTQLGVLFYLPGIASAVSFMDEHVHALGLGPEVLPRAMYGLWWLVGCLALACLWCERDAEADLPSTVLRIGRAVLLLPLASILVHLLSLHWLYSLPFQAGHLSPLLLGLSTYASVTFGSRLGRYRSFVRWGGAGLAILFSQNAPELWTLTSQGVDWVVSPFRVTLVGLTLALLFHRALDRENRFRWAAGALLLVALSGPTPAAVVKNWAHAAPTTAFEVGTASIVSAFAFLALGFARSLLAPQDGDGRPGPERKSPSVSARAP